MSTPPVTPSVDDVASVLGNRGTWADQGGLQGDSTAPAQASAPPDTSNLPVGTRTGPASPVQAVAPKRGGLLSDVLHAVGDVLAPKTTQRINPQTGQIEDVPLSTGARVGNAVATVVRGAAAGAAQTGPGAAGKAALAGVQAQQQFQTQQEGALQERAKLTQAELRDAASRAMISQDIAKSTWEMQREKTPVDDTTIERFDSIGKLLASDDRNQNLGLYPTALDFFRVHPNLDAVKLQSQGKLAVVTQFDDEGRPSGVRIWKVDDGWREGKTGNDLTMRTKAGVDDSGNPKYSLQTIPAGATTNGNYLMLQSVAGHQGLSASLQQHLADQTKWQPYEGVMSVKGEPLMRDEHGNIRVAGTGQSVNRVLPAPKDETNAQADQEYRDILKKQKLGQPLTQDDRAAKFAYEQQKTLGPRTTFNLQQGSANAPLSPKQQAISKAILEGRTAPPSGIALRTPFWQDVMGDVYAQDPQFSDQRAQLRKDFTVGKDSGQINSINVALGHLGVLGDSIDALNNQNIVGLNKIANSLGIEVGKTPATTFQAIVHRVGPEVSSAYLGSGGSAGERGSNEADFDFNLGPAQLKNNVAITVKLLRSKIAGLENQWNQNKSDSMPDFQSRFIMPEAKAVLGKYGNAGGPPQGRPVRDGKGNVLGYTVDGKTMTPVGAQ